MTRSSGKGTAWVSFQLDDTDLQALAHYYGRPEGHRATRADFRHFVHSIVTTTLDDVRYEYENGRSRPTEDHDDE